MQVPTILQGESRTRLLQGIAIGAIASMVIGFSWGGWVTGGTADKVATERANTAVLAALTPICVEKFLQNSDAKANLASLQKISSTWELALPITIWPERVQRSWCNPKLRPNEPNHAIAGEKSG
jgi:hypothetical protein